jgi:hypothetical protein
MNKFLELNRHKLKFAFTTTALMFLAILLVLLAIGYFKDQLPKGNLLIIIFLVAAIGFPILILIISYLAWQFKQAKKEKAFSKPPFDQLENIGFSNALINTKTKWAYTEEVKVGNVNGFNLIGDVSNNKSHILEFRVLVALKKIKKSEYERISKKFGNYNIEFELGSLVKKYNTKRLSVHTIQNLKRDLEEFTELLKHEGFEPQKENSQV